MSEKCGSTIGFDATDGQEKWFKARTIPHREFECRKERGHKGLHRDYGSITCGSVSTDYSVEWSNPHSVVDDLSNGEKKNGV